MKHRGPRAFAAPALNTVRLYLALFGLCICVFPAFGMVSPARGATLQIPYTVTFRGVHDSDLETVLRRSASTVTLQNRAPATIGMLKKRAQDDIPHLLETLQAQSYFAASIDLSVHPAQGDETAQVVYTVHPGQAFTIRDVRISLTVPDTEPKPNLPSRSKLGVSQGQPATAERIRRARSDLESDLAAQGYILSKLDQPTVYIQPDQAGIDLTYTGDTGPLVRFGRTVFHGLRRVHEDYVRTMIPWQPGQTYDPQAVRTLKNRLIQTGLFSLVQVNHQSALNPAGRMPMTVTVHEIKHKRVSMGLGYETDLGLKGSATWAHDNLFGRGKKLSVNLEASQVRQELLASLRQEHLFDQPLDFTVQGSAFREDTDAYTSTGGEIRGRMEFQFTDKLRLGAGAGYKGNRITDQEGERTFHQLSFPAFADWDTRDSVLNPVKGMHIAAHSTPVFGLLGQNFTMLKAGFSTRLYRDLLHDSGRAVLAWRGKAGTVASADIQDIPADERLYAGGGGSIRGYSYQSVGPYRDGDPYGGRSLLETSAELRWKWTDTIGSVLFVDGGNAYTDMVPDPMDLYWGAGIGARYYTAVGPLRLDLAFPLRKDEHVDASFQVYISLGQSF